MMKKKDLDALSASLLYNVILSKKKIIDYLEGYCGGSINKTNCLSKLSITSVEIFQSFQLK